MFTCLELHPFFPIWLMKNPSPVYLPYISCYQHYFYCPLNLLHVLVSNHQLWFFPLTVLKMTQVECRNVYVVLVMSQLACIGYVFECWCRLRIKDVKSSMAPMLIVVLLLKFLTMVKLDKMTPSPPSIYSHLQP